MSDQSDFFNFYFDFRDRTEPPLIFHRWSMLTCLSAYLGRRCWYPFGDGRLFPNFYTMLIGHPGSRKSTAIKLAKKIVSQAGYNKYSAEKTSKEKFLMDLEGKEQEEAITDVFSKRGRQRKTHEDLTEILFGKEKTDAIKEPREVFIVADEFNEFVGSGNLEFLSLLGMLWDWDDQDNEYQFRLKNSKSVSIYQPTISILSGNTHSGFVEAFPPQAIGQGFLSRIILVYGEPSGKKIPDPETPDENMRKELLNRLEAIQKTVVGPIEKTADAKHALGVIYNTWKNMEDGRFIHYAGRRHSHLLKLTMIVAASRCSTLITEQDVIYANSVLTYTEADMPKALGEFGKSRDSDVANKVMQALYESVKPLEASDLMRVVNKDINKQQDLVEILLKLQNAGQIQHIQHQGFLPKQKPINSKLLYYNPELLREYQVKYGMTNIRRIK